MVTAKDLVKKWQEVGTGAIKSTTIYKQAVAETSTKAEKRSSNSGSVINKSTGQPVTINGITLKTSNNSSTTKAETRQINLTNTFNPFQQDSWQNAIKSYSSSSFLGKIYKKADYGLFGYLPGGYTPTQVKAMDTDLKTADIYTITKAQQRQQQAKQYQDLTTTSGVEKVGQVIEDVTGGLVVNPFISPEEKFVKNQQDAITTAQIIGQNEQQLQDAYSNPYYFNSGYGFDSGQASNTNNQSSLMSYAVPLLIGGVILLGIFGDK